MLKHDKIYKILSVTLLSMLVISLVIAGLVFIAPSPALAAPPPPLETDDIGLGCVCEQYGFLFECCSDAYWHEGDPGWLECQGNITWTWYLPSGCDIWD